MANERERISSLLFYSTLILLGYLAYQVVEPFLVQIGWAVVLTICLNPLQTRLRRRLGPNRSAVLLTLLVVALLVVPILFAVLAIRSEGGQVVTSLRTQLEDRGGAAAELHAAWEWVRLRMPFLPPEEELIAKATAQLGDITSFIATRAGGVLKSAANFFFELLITLAILFFLLRDSTPFAAGLRRLLPFDAEQNERLLRLSRDLVSASVTAAFAIAFTQGVIGGVTFALLGIQGAAVWGLMMAVLSFVPLVGATLIWLPAAVWLILSGSLTKGLILLAVGLGILSNVDNVVRALLLSGKARMNTLVLLLSLLGGVSAFGFIGVVLGPMVASLLTALVETYTTALPEPAPAAAPDAGVTPQAPDDAPAPKAS